jgi:SAM-dependent methyltransferase
MDWHKHFVQQAAWTIDLRTYLFRRTGMETACRVLEVGCGTGAILADLDIPVAIHGLDLQPFRLMEASRNAPQASLACGDALSLPYASGVFDITFCHFLLLWVRDPLQALREMKRLTRPGGSILALAEPDYSNRVDKPDELAELGRWQAESLQRQGADPGLGKRLAELFRQAGIPLIETGSLRADGRRTPGLRERNMEWAALEADLAGLIPMEEVQRLKRLDKRAWQRGERVLYVPTYFAWGQLTQMV